MIRDPGGFFVPDFSSDIHIFAMVFPVDMSLHSKSRRFDIAFDDGSEYQFPYEFLRVYSPSAEVQGHAPGEEMLQVGKMNVGVEGVDAVGNYAIRFRFDDGHDSGLYTFEYLEELGKNQTALWEKYLKDIEASEYSRDPADEKTAKKLADDKLKAQIAKQCQSHHH